MMKVLNWLFAFWPKLPKLIQVAIAIAIAICIVALPITFLLYTLNDGSLQEKMGFEVPTKTDLTNAANSITEEVATNQNAGLLALKDSLATVDSTMRADYLAPGVEILRDLVKRVKEVERHQGETRSSLNSIGDNSTEQLRRLDELAQDDTQVDLEGMIRREFANVNNRLDDQQQQLEELKTRRTSKVRIP